MNFLRKKLGLFHYNIGFFDFNPSSLLKEKFKVCWLKHSYKDRFFADPFILSVSESEIKVLVEDFEYSRWKGNISLLVVDRQSYVLKRKKTLLDLDTHLSFPFILRIETDIYVIPENSASGQLTAWHYDDASESLAVSSVLVDMPVVDPVLWTNEQDYFLFGSLAGKDENGALYQWKSHLPLTGYQLTSLSPLKQGKVSSRRGGDFFVMSGAIYAATQCCEHSYGEALNICKVGNIGCGELSETVISTLKPHPPYVDGLHTFNVYRGVCVVDGLTFLYSSRPWKKIKLIWKRQQRMIKE